MNSSELKHALQLARMGHIEAARELGVNPVQVIAWIDGREDIPADIGPKVWALAEKQGT